MNNKEMQKIWEGLTPLYDVINSVEKLMRENKELRDENKYLKERLDWFEKSLERNAKASGEAVHHLIEACLDGRIEIKNDKTIITKK